MDPQRFDTLVRTLTRGSSRRRLLGLLAVLPVMGSALANHDDTSAEDKGRGKVTGNGKDKRRKQRQRDQRNRSQEKTTAEACPLCRRPDRRGRCVADPSVNFQCCTATGGRRGFCLLGACFAGRCRGSNCNDQGCPPCQFCDASSGVCVPDASQDGQCCTESSGQQFCQSGACVAVPDSGTIQQCQGACGVGRTVSLCGKTMACPDCAACTPGCDAACGAALVGPLDTGFYCMKFGSGLCLTGGCAAGEQCCSISCVSTCVP